MPAILSKRRGNNILSLFFLLTIGTLFVLYLIVSHPLRAMGMQSPILEEVPPAPNDVDSVWDFDQPPVTNTTGHLIFHSVGSLLQHWPNTLYRNGHNIVPGTIPAGTLLYRGSPIERTPSRLDWVAFDLEHANYFCFGNKESGCWQLTYMTTRPLNILYFDGTSAGKMEGGTMDSQDLVAWGKLRSECIFGERFRIRDLCEWGSKHGLDGFIRMEFDFEMMVCDFNNGIETVSSLNLQYDGPPFNLPPGTPLTGPPDCGIHARSPPPQPPNYHYIFKPDPKKHLFVTESGSWHRHYPGEPRVQLDLTRLISFYDINSFPSLVPGRFGQERWKHRLEGISKHDVDGMYKILDDVLGPDYTKHGGSGVDWSAYLKVVMNRYGKRLEMLQFMLQEHASTTVQETNWTATAIEAHDYVTAMLTSYIILTAVPSTGDVESPDLAFPWAKPVFKECATSHTAPIEKLLSPRFTHSERLILHSLKVTNQEICRILVHIWAEGVLMKSHGFDPKEADLSSMKETAKKWENEVTELMTWLGWDIWTTCRPACGPEELCYLPTWPFFYSNHSPPHLSPTTPPGEGPLRYSEVDRPPKPFCIRRLPPFPALE